MPATFRHLVGRSTLTQGIAIRRDFEEWFDAPPKGEARSITLAYGPEQSSVEVVLRRVNNESGSVQIRYQSRRQKPFREWLSATFDPADRAHNPLLLELHKIGEDAYRVAPLLRDDRGNLHLCLGPALYHNNAASLERQTPVFQDISEAISAIPVAPGVGQAHYNEQIRQQFVARGWSCNEPVVPELPLRSDFKRGDVQVEVEFGNARSYYQDYLKFLLPFTRGIIRIGVLLVPTTDFARLLCMMGTRRAVERANRAGVSLTRPPKYSGMITYEKVEREFEPLRFVLNMPLVVRGVDFWGGCSAGPTR